MVKNAINLLRRFKDKKGTFYKTICAINEAIEELESIKCYGECRNCKKCDFSKSEEQTFHKGYCNDLLMPVNLNFGCNKWKEK